MAADPSEDARSWEDARSCALAGSGRVSAEEVASGTPVPPLVLVIAVLVMAVLVTVPL
jgi:hypothetical protein